jgi:hypothetical protein
MGRLVLTLAFVLSAFLASCGGGGGSGGGGSGAPSTGGGGGGSVADRGDFRLGNFATDYVVEQTGQPAIDMNAMRQLFADVASSLNDLLKLNKDITISSIDCKTVNAFYSPRDSMIVMCTEMYLTLLTYFAKKFNDPQNAPAYALLAFMFIFGHELGHALIDNYNLPILGKQEDAADAMSVVLWMETAETPDEKLFAVGLVLMGAQFLFDLTKDSPYYGEHSTGPVRLANIVCWAGGAYPEALQNSVYANIYVAMVKSGRNCQYEYMEKKKSVEQLLGPYLKS